MNAKKTTEIIALVRLAFPIVVAQLAHISLGVTDTILVGPLGPAAIGGVGVGNSIYFAVIVVGLGILLSMDSFVSSALGAKKPDLAHQYMIQGLWLALVASAPITLAMWIVAEVFPAFGSSPDIVAVAQPFLRISATSIPFFLISVALQRYWQARQQALIVTFTGIMACVLNVVAIYAFVYGKWGFQSYGAVGVAYSTLCCRILIAALLWVYTEVREGILFSDRSARFDWVHFRDLLIMGLPSGGQCLLEVGVFCIAGVFCTRFGATSAAAHHVVLTIASFTFMFPLGIGSATAVRVGYHRGSGKLLDAIESGWLGIILAASVMSLCGVALMLMPETFVRIFTQDVEIISMALRLMVLAALFQVFDGIQVAVTGALRGMENTTTAMWMNLLGHYGFGLGLMLVLNAFFDFQVRGVWMGLTTGLMVVASTLIMVWSRLSVKISNH